MRLPILVLTAVFFATSSASGQMTNDESPHDAETTFGEQSLGEIVSRYEALVMASDPGARARSEQQPQRRWPDVSPKRIARTAVNAERLKLALAELPTQNSIDVKILNHLLDELITEADFDTARIPFTGDWGFHAEPIFAAGSTRFSTVRDVEAWIARLNDLPRYFEQNTENMRRGLDTGWVSHADPLATVMEQVRGQIVKASYQSDLWVPFESFPENISQEERERLLADATLAVGRAVDAYASLLEFLERDYAPNTREYPGIGSIPYGKDYYRKAISNHTAGAGYTPEEIHELGKEEVTRIRAEMEIIIDEVGYQRTFAEFLTFLRTDPQFYAQCPQELMEKAALISKRLDAILPRYFGTLPRLTYGVEPVPASIAPGYTTGRYSGGDPEKGVSGTYLVNTYALDQRPLYELPALSAHEAVPGHHLQIALAQELQDVPRFRRSFYATAFGEGWGLYAERLAGEAGIYETPYERFGALSYEMWRACRLVADTGLHWYGWSREQAEECFQQNSALAPLNIKTEVTRYIGWPGQATAYKVGELKILRLRKQAEDALGQQFDIRAFHDEVLGAGSMPLDALQTRIHAWIGRELASSEGRSRANAP